MSDLLLKGSERGYDIVIEDNDVLLTDSLQDAVIVSLSTWKRKSSISGIATTEENIGGWWADALNEYPTGSLLWTLFRMRLDDSTAEQARSMARNALEWIVKDGVAKSIDVTTSIVDRHSLQFYIVIHKPNGGDEEVKWMANWEAS